MNDASTPRDTPADDDQPLVRRSSARQGTTPEGLFPKQPVADQCKGRLAFLLVLICYAIVDYGRLQWVPTSLDTGHAWHVFYASYVELVYHNDLAHWFPYGAYGQPNTIYSLMDLTPTDYLMMAIGKVFQIKNALVLFQLSLMAKHLLFLFGIHLLSRHLFRRQSTIWLCLIGSIAFLYAFQLNQRQVMCMVEWYPLVLYFLARFFRDKWPEGLWISGTIFTVSCLGNAYEQPWLLMALFPFVAVATWKHPRAWREVFRCRAGNLAAMVLFVAAASLYLYMALNILEGVETVRGGRTSSTGVVDLSEFSGAKTRIYTLYEVVLSFVCGHAFYIGLLPLACILWGIFRVRTPLFAVFMAASLLFIWFPLGGVLALALYYSVPFISLLHFIYMGFHFLPLTLLLAAGAAWEEFEPSRKNLKVGLLFPVIVLLAIDFSFYGYNLGLTPQHTQALLSSSWMLFLKLGMYAGVLGLAAILSLVYRCRCRGREMDRSGMPESPPAPADGGRLSTLMSFHTLAVVALLTGLFLDVFAYSFRSGLPENGIGDGFEAPKSNWHPVAKSSPAYQAGLVQPLTWQGERLDQPHEERQRVALETPSYFYTYAFAQFDPCQRVLEWFSIGTAMQKLLALRDENDRALQTILGCHAPKLRLLTQAFYANSEAEAAAAVRSQGDLANVLILQWPSDVPQPRMPRLSTGESPGSIRVTDFGANAIELKVNVTAPDGAWLVYADAYDPRWRAWINGKPVPIVPAYVGLKAVWVPHGESVVRMKFAAWSSVGVRVLAIGGALCSLSLLLYCGFCCVRGFPGDRKAGPL